MDLKSKGITWVGNMYQKFESICHEVDEFINKDTAKYLESQVQTVNEGVKKIYSNVLPDVHPSFGDNKEANAQAVTKKQDDAIGTSVSSVVCVDEKPTHYSEMALSEELEPANLRNFDSSEVDSLRRLSFLPEDEENASHWEESRDAVFPKSTVIVEKDVGLDDNCEASHLSHRTDVDPCKLQLDIQEQHFLPENAESPEDRKLTLPSDMSHSQDKRSNIVTDSPRNVIEDEEVRTSKEQETKCNSTYPSETMETGFSLGQCVEENTMIVEHPACENVSCSEDKNSDNTLCIKEQMPLVDDLFSPEDKILCVSSSLDEDRKCAVLVKHLPDIVTPDVRIRCGFAIEKRDDCADLSEKVKTDTPLQQDGLGLEVSLTEEHPLVDSRSTPNCGSSSGMSLFLREQHPFTEESSSVKDESLPKISLISTNVNSEITTVDKFLPEISVSSEWLGLSEDEEGFLSRTSFSGEADMNLSVDGCHSCMLSELGLEENILVQKFALMEHLGGSKDSCDSFVHSRELHLGVEGFNSPKQESSSKPSPTSGQEEHTATVAANFLPTYTCHDSGLGFLHTDDEETYAVCSDVFSTSAVPSDLESSNISQLHHVVQSEPSVSSSTEFSHANYTEKTEKMCCDSTHSTCSALDLSTMSYVSLSGLGSHERTGNQIPAFSRTSSSADILDDLAIDIVAADLETIDLSDKANLEESCPILDDELPYTPSFRYRRFRSYKELIKEAFASRKRLVKEYKQLPIWYGDLDTEARLLSDNHLVPRSALSSSSSASTSTSTSSHPSNIGESDWELL